MRSPRALGHSLRLGLLVLLGLAPLAGAGAVQAQGGYVIDRPRPLSPAEQAEKDRQDRAAAAERAQRKARVDTLVARMGEHRRGEAERMIEMQDAAARARGTPAPVPAPIPVATPEPPVVIPPPRICSYPASQGGLQGVGRTQEGARQDLMKRLPKYCYKGQATLVGSISCSRPRVVKSGKITAPIDPVCNAQVACPAYQRPCPTSSGPAPKVTRQ